MNKDNVQNSGRTQLRVERQWGQLIGTNIRTFDSANTLVCFAHAKAFKLKEEIGFFADEAKTQKIFSTKARNIIDFAPTYDMIMPDGTIFGSLKRKGISSSFVQDAWIIMNTDGQEIGSITEDSALLGVIRRFVDFASYFMPQTYSVKFGENDVAEIKQKKNPFTVKYEYSIDSALYEQYKLLFIAIANQLALIEARQN